MQMCGCWQRPSLVACNTSDRRITNLTPNCLCQQEAADGELLPAASGTLPQAVLPHQHQMISSSLDRKVSLCSQPSLKRGSSCLLDDDYLPTVSMHPRGSVPLPKRTKRACCRTVSLDDSFIPGELGMPCFVILQPIGFFAHPAEAYAALKRGCINMNVKQPAAVAL